ncbi:MAG: hypothetical protein P8Q14_02895 [Vicingaceae bacterium]|nr:hypothetical protein [Vicingaceae bacterium]
MFNIFKRKQKKGCPICNKEKTLAFSASLLETEYKAEIKKNERIGEIDLYICSDCNTEFFKEEHMFHKLTEKQKGLLIQFYKRNLALNNKFQEQINTIGITEDWNSDKILPAKIELISGEKYDFARIRISKKPPLGYSYDYFKDYIFIDQIKSIKKSDFALSKEVREKSKNAEELRMSFYPTVLKTKDEVKVVINGLSLFFNNQNIKGSELTLANEFWDFKNDKYIYDNETNNKVLVIVSE